MATTVYDYTTAQADLIQFYDYYRSALVGHKYNARKLSKAKALSGWSETIAAIASSGAVASWFLWQTPVGQIAFQTLLLASAISSILRASFGLSQELNLRSRLASSWQDLHLEMQDAIRRIRLNETVTESDRARMELLSERFRKLNSTDPATPDEKLQIEIENKINEAIPPETLWLPRD